jgi:signal transduction histidine kinase
MPTILVIDDEEITRLALEYNLHREGYEVILAVDGAEGIQKAQTYLPEVVICDWNMPGLSGLDVCHKLKTDRQLSMATFLMLTCRDSLESRIQGLDAGADDYLLKPIEFEELRARLRSGLRQHQLKRLMRIANEKLQETLGQLQETQAQLIQSEKMSSLGKMVAGIAHEINNPINFIGGNLSHIEDYFQNLLDLIELYQQHLPQPLPAVIQEHQEEMDLAFLRKDLPELLTSMKMGSQRIQNIVLTLRNFARLDEAELKSVDVHEGLDNTLLLLQQRLQLADGRQIQIARHYQTLPVVTCYPSELNQVFFNLLSNAIDFLEIKAQTNQDFTPTIEVRSSLVDADRIGITISDNGPGMTAENCERAFDPFYTTKPVGRGMGMGLATSYQIIRKHQGTLDCQSQLGEGSTFHLVIPCQSSIPDTSSQNPG